MRLTAVLLTLSVMLTSCGIPLTPAEFNKTPEAKFLQSIVERLSAREFASIEGQLDPKLIEPDIRAALERTASALPSASVQSIQPVAWFVATSSNGPRSATVAAQYAYPDSKWFVVSAQLTGEPASFRILRFNLEPLPASMEEIHAFTFAGKGVVHYVFAFLALAACAVSLYAFVRCLRTKGLRRKWLWSMITLLGFCAFTLNWTSGAVSMNPLAFNVLSAGLMRPGWLGPWALTFCIPLGAFVFLWKHGNGPSAVPTEG